MDGSFATDQATVSYDDGESIDFSSAGQFITGFKMGKRERDIRKASSPGEDGSGTKDFGERSQWFSVKVCYIAASEAAVLASINADLRTLARVSDADFTDFSYTACRLDDNKFEQARPALFGTTVQCEGWLHFECVRP